MSETARGAVAEFVAAFAVVLVGAATFVLGRNGQLDLTGIALAYGFAVAVMVSTTAHESGGFANPAIAISLWVTGKLSSFRAVSFIGAELLGGVAAGFLLRYAVPRQMFDAAAGGVTVLDPRVPPGKGIVIEAVATFVLAFAVFGTAVDDRGRFGKTGSLTVGLVLAFDVLAFGPYTGAAANPARWFGPALAAGAWSHWWVWIVGPVSGSIIAATLYWGVFLRGREPATP